MLFIVFNMFELGVKLCFLYQNLWFICFYTMDTYRWQHQSYGGKWESLSTLQSKEKHGQFFVFVFFIILLQSYVSNVNGFRLHLGSTQSTLGNAFWKAYYSLDWPWSIFLSFSQDLHNCLVDIPHFLWEGILV